MSLSATRVSIDIPRSSSRIGLETGVVSDDDRRAGEPWGLRLWLNLALVVVLALLLQSYGIATWPMADDEVPSLVELGLLHNGAEHLFSVPADQIPKLPKATIVWNKFQRFAIDHLPATEVSYRIPGLICGLLTSALVFVIAARSRGLWFASALSLLVNGSQTFVYLMPLNRFYALPMLLLTVVLAIIVLADDRVVWMIAVAVLTPLAVLSHNVTVVIFVMTFLAALPMWFIGWTSLRFLIRTAIAASASVLMYVFYLLPLVRGWSSTGNPTPVLVSFAAHAGTPALALTFLGLCLTLIRRGHPRIMVWWSLMFLGGLCVVQLTSMTWNPRYFLFFLPAVWVLGAHAVESIARRLGYQSLALAWYAAVFILLLPNLMSHFADGSRHDYRTAAAIVIENDRLESPVLSDDAETISYYLPDNLRRHLEVRTRVTTFPRSEFFLVCRSNAWMPLPVVPGRQMDLLGEIYHRRIDQFSHILRVYRVHSDGPAT